MPKYTVHMSQVLSVTVEVEAESPEEAAEVALDEAPRGLCRQCAGYGHTYSRDDSGELEWDVVMDESGAEVLEDNHVWQRALAGGAR